jgi:threonine dehydratase
MVLRCRGCGTEVDPLGPSPWACPHRHDGDDVDHVLVVPLPDPAEVSDPGSRNPFVRYRRRLASWRAATAAGLADEAYVGLVEALDARVSEVDGTGFRVTPYVSHPGLAEALGARELWGKDETGNVAGSHKGRHLMGLAIWLAARAELGVGGDDPDAPLAISSCGNAALAAATLARAMERRLDVFVPTWADPVVLARLDALGARVHVCERRDGEAGDPCLHRFRNAVAAGAVPFCCTGPDAGLTIDGGRTLGWELAEQMASTSGPLDVVAIQVGGGALGTSLVDGLRVGPLPRVLAVQTEGCAPFDRAVQAVGDEPIETAVRHRGSVMWPWEDEPHSAATGILDDETYDWAGLLDGVRVSVGGSVVATEYDVNRALELTHRLTDVEADATGCAGVAGLLATSADPRPTTLGVVFTGAVRRGPGAS